MIFKYGGASARLVEVDENKFALTNLWSNNRGLGEAREVMLKIAKYADEHGLTVILVAREYGGPVPAMSNRQLEAFYAKFGFEVISPTPPYTMERVPSREIHAS